MNFWINSESNSDNVVVLTDTSILVGSCDKENVEKARNDLKSDVSPSEVLGTEGLTAIPYHQIQNLRIYSTDTCVLVDYRANKAIEHTSISLESSNDTKEFVTAIAQHLPDTLEKTVSQQSVLSAAVGPTISLAMCAGTSFLFFNKLRIVVYIVGGLWALASLMTLYSRTTNPPEVTQWKIRGKHIRKAWHGIKTAGSMALVTAIVVGVSYSLPDSHGTNALSDRLQHEMLSADDVRSLVDRGADLNYLDSDGYTPLIHAIAWSEYEVATALVEAGADLGVVDSVDMTALEYALYDGGSPETLLSAILQRGGLQAAEQAGFNAAQYSDDYEDDTLLRLMEQHNLVADSTY